ncbi:phosphonate metabolism protein/1,5-bisphosphokinase (PRPP-forming) PhnN [Roseibium suaedae]|uniref:Ribose 1,5-bisphosphate phosphokinase PhnN n=1 Tax=Roseibium suaedae TaxID=735517 RepID=A0A1M7I7Y2_9HYPH|nr:phosphonate metabolism protein/1,5-bisphosphokinase (PRPP-forming) PhnN [Roseibium suaedae]SHM36758.1 ribose 1,5-bisphosphokinase [Roseibium suaedae]
MSEAGFSLNGTSGVFFAVVGSSGVGKDSLIAYARKELDTDPRFVFTRRTVTRTAHAELEDHDSLSLDEFERQEAQGRFAMTWEAHGLRYGLPASILGDLAAGKVVTANLSRKMLEAARKIFDRLQIVEITAPAEIRAQRLASRGRESAAAVEARLNRTVVPVAGQNVTRIENAGTLAEAGEQLAALLRDLAYGSEP